MGASYFDRQELRNIGLSEPMINTMEKIKDFVDLVDTASATQTQLDATDSDLDDTIAALVVLQGEIDDVEDGSTVIPTYVQKDQEAAPSFTPYAGQTVSAGYVQSEAQATDDAVGSLASTVDSLITALQAADVLT